MCIVLLLVGMKAVTKESKNNHFMGSVTGHVIGIGDADAISGGCFKRAVVRGLEYACMFSDLGHRFVGVLMCMVLLCVGMNSVTKGSKNNHFIGSPMGHIIVVGAHGADAVSGGYFNRAVV
jgi:hypothetical protein